MDLPEEEKTRGLIMLSAHHSFADGVSSICLALAVSDEYGREYFVPGKDAKPWESWLIRFLFPFYIPYILYLTVGTWTDSNFLTKNK